MNGEWRSRAACRSVDTEVMYPLPGDKPGISRAVAVCLSCPVRVECLRHAVAAQEGHGVWGGLTARQRWQILARHPRGFPHTEEKRVPLT